ncbi:hypothetical protein AALO_G00288930 [Alosa alosa]|uniref:Uncharacterized protein n=1 Tax=Alosa alosa TaxID=278164 RepID=A0AAV6FG98_9TELE|nr:hypothetical protein AALO_G00288930 [Alosa alosa]
MSEHNDRQEPDIKDLLGSSPAVICSTPAVRGRSSTGPKKLSTGVCVGSPHPATAPSSRTQSWRRWCGNNTQSPSSV